MQNYDIPVKHLTYIIIFLLPIRCDEISVFDQRQLCWRVGWNFNIFYLRSLKTRSANNSEYLGPFHFIFTAPAPPPPLLLLLMRSVNIYPLRKQRSKCRHNNPPGVGGGTPIWEWQGCSLEISNYTPKRNQLIWAWLKPFLTSKRYHYTRKDTLMAKNMAVPSWTPY